MKLWMALSLVAFAGAAIAGPISKFDGRRPTATFTSASKLEDVERCLIDLDHLMIPVSYRQPDRPDRATIIWGNGQGVTVWRVDLTRTNSGTLVKAWLDADRVKSCAAPSAG